MDEHKHWFDLAAVGGILTSLFDALPHVLAILASFLAVVWWTLRVYEMRTVQNWLRHRRYRK